MRERSIEYLLLRVYILFTILSAYSIAFLKNSIVIYSGIVLPMGLCFFVAMNRFRKVKKQTVAVVAFYLASYALLMGLGTGYSDLTFQVISLLFLLFFVVLSNACAHGRLKLFMDVYETTVFVIACISLFMYLLCTVVRVLPSTGYIDLNWSPYYDYTNFGWLYFEGQRTNLFGAVYMRNIALFAEGPIFSCILTIALYIELYICKKGKLYLFVILVAMLTTFSTTSLAVGSVLLFIKFYNRYLKNKRLIVVAPVIGIAAAWFVILVLIDKLHTTNISGSIRMDDLQACFKSFAQSPLIGNGYQNIDALAPFRASWRGSMAGNSTGIGGILSNGGIVLGMWYCVPLFMAIAGFVKKRELRPYYGLVMLIFLIFFIMIIHYTGLGAYLLAIQWAIVTCLGRKNAKKRTLKVLQRHI